MALLLSDYHGGLQAEMMLEDWQVDDAWKPGGMENSKEKALARCVPWQRCRDSCAGK